MMPGATRARGPAPIRDQAWWEALYRTVDAAVDRRIEFGPGRLKVLRGRLLEVLAEELGVRSNQHLARAAIMVMENRGCRGRHVHGHRYWRGAEERHGDQTS